MLQWFRKRLALRSHRRRLGPALAQRYGRERFYSINQVRATVDKLGLNSEYICYAYADYCSHDDFDAHHSATGEVYDWSAMRQELADSWGIGDHHHCVGGHSGDYDHGHHHDSGYDHGGHGHHDSGYDHGGHGHHDAGHDGGGHH